MFSLIVFLIVFLENLRCRSVDMMKKELLTSVVAYNLVIQFRRQAAEVAKLPPRRVSFKEVWYTSRYVPGGRSLLLGVRLCYPSADGTHETHLFDW